MATASDSDGYVPQILFYIDGTFLVSSGNNGSGTYPANWNTATVGTHTITAVATDNGGATAISAPITVSITASAPPSIVLAAPAASSYVAPASIPLSATVSAGSGAEVLTVNFYNGSTPIAQGLLAGGAAGGYVSSGSYVGNWSNAPAGTYSITAVATDSFGTSTTSAPVSVTIAPNPAPTVTLGVPGNNIYTAPASIPLSATAGSSSAGITQVQFYSGSTLLGTGFLAAGNASSGTYVSNPWTAVPAGNYVLTAVATDSNGVTTTSSPVTVIVNPAPAQGGAGMYFITTDHLNTPRLVQDQFQKAVWTWDQGEPFGDSVPNQNPQGASSGGAFVFNLRYPGQYADLETGTSYNYYRDYYPATGRYVQSDPVGFRGGINTYAYVGSNPIATVDPKGLFSPGVHHDLTVTGAEAAGMQPWEANIVANWVVAADTGTQGVSDAHQHGMCIPGESKGDCQSSWQNLIQDELGKCTYVGLGNAVHALQDSYAAGHLFRNYYGFWTLLLPMYWGHGVGDFFPGESKRRAVENVTEQMIRDWIARCKCQQK